MNQTTATTIVNNKIGEIVLTRFKGLPVCYADNVEEYRIYIPIIERLNTNIGNFFEIRICFLIGKHWKEFTVSISLSTILSNDCFGNVQKKDICFHTCFLSLSHNPLLIAKGNDVIGSEIGYIYIG